MTGFSPIRRGLIEHIREGKFCPSDLGIYTFLQLTADWATGVCYTCAAGIASQFGDPGLKELVQKALRRLRENGYINYQRGHGQRGLYPILINKYEPTVGALCGKRLNAFAENSLDKPVYEAKNGEATAEPRSSHGGDTVARTVETPIQEVKTLDLKDVKTLQDKGVGANAPARPREKRSCQMPDGFQPKESHRQLAAKLGIDLDSAFEKFTDYHLSKGSKFKDWDRALNNWLRNEVSFGSRVKPPKPNGKARDLGKQNFADARMQFMERPS
jgi:hypothetical protein